MRSPYPRKTTCASSARTARSAAAFRLPNTVNAEAIGADYKNGVLTVTLPKREESKPRQVKVTVTAATNGK